MSLYRKYNIRILFTLLFAFIFCFTVEAKDFVVVIDAGHGGKDMGAPGLISYEKNINLGVALKLGDMIKSKFKDVKVVYTRDDDTYLTLQERANVANKVNGDLFISIHTNSVAKKTKNRTTISGAATYTLGLHRSDENLEVAKRENSVIELEQDYSKTYRGFDPNSSESYIIFEISQRQHMDQSINFASFVQKELATTASRDNKGVRQAGFWVLAATSMPAVLVELDFICNPESEKFLISDDGQDKLATGIYNAFYSYKYLVDKKMKAILVSKQKEEKQPNNYTKEKEQPKKQQETENVGNNQDKNIPDIVVKNETDSEYQYSIRSKNSKNKKNKKDKPVLKDKPVSKDKPKTVPVLEDKPIKKESVKEPNATLTNKAEKDQKVTYKIQFMTSTKELPTGSPLFRKLYPVEFYVENNIYKYTYGETGSLSEAKRVLKIVKAKFKEAFIIKFVDGKRLYN
ncbi:MAG: N-acetylmuramoyl-L-alanine amidase [Muribaculaceae bacterium]|nr:N-acetylmuramoyl-L-alanine amidase [Muribaculaceae bacterium]